jgi:hypothetical protein
MRRRSPGTAAEWQIRLGWESFMRASRFVLAALAFLLAAAPAARATTTHWYYVVPGSCNVSPDGNSGIGTVALISGNIGADYYGNSVNQIVTCALRLPQGATITTTRTWGDDPRTGGASIQWNITQTSYIAPDQTQTLLMAKSAQGTKTYWWGAPYNPIPIDNENNAYVLQLYLSGGVHSITRLVEITYTMP